MNRKCLVVITWKPEAAALASQVLLLKVTPNRGGFWQPVTGKVEEGESFAAAALREAEEETGFRFERQPQFLGLDFEFEGKKGEPVFEKAFLLPLVGGATPPTPTLDPNEHTEFRWAPTADAPGLVKFDGNREAIERATKGAPPLFLSRSGKFFQEGEEITHERTALLLHRSLIKAGTSYLVRMGEEELDVVVESTPRFVKSFSPETGEIHLSHGEKEELRPETLAVQKDHSLTCETKSGLTALFLSPAYYEITKLVKESSDGKEFLLHFRGRDYHLRIPS